MCLGTSGHGTSVLRDRLCSSLQAFVSRGCYPLSIVIIIMIIIHNIVVILILMIMIIIMIHIFNYYSSSSSYCYDYYRGCYHEVAVDLRVAG